MANTGEPLVEMDIELLSARAWRKCEELANSLGFSKGQFDLLAGLAQPERFGDPDCPAELKLQSINILASRADGAYEVINAIRSMLKKRRSNPIVDTLLSWSDEHYDHFHRLPIGYIAAEIGRRRGRPYKGQELFSLVDNIKKTRQYLRKKFGQM